MLARSDPQPARASGGKRGDIRVKREAQERRARSNPSPARDAKHEERSNPSRMRSGKCRERGNPQTVRSSESVERGDIRDQHRAQGVERGAIRAKRGEPSVERGAICDRCGRQAKRPEIFGQSARRKVLTMEISVISAGHSV